jgi:hypothetical protein
MGNPGMPVGTTWNIKSDDEIKDALLKCKGNISQAAKELGYSARWTLAKRLSNHPDLLEFQLSCLEERIDNAEQVIQEALDKRSLDAAMFVLKTQGKGRGWGDSLDVTSHNFNMTITFDESWSKEDLRIWNEQRKRILDASAKRTDSGGEETRED